jgi:cytochrome c oxidase assembly protein subunit 15
MTSRNTLNPGTAAAPDYRRGSHWMALFGAMFTLPLLFVGGSVTTYRVGLAVPDWPSTFGINMFLYDFWNAPFGVRVEHTHRLYGAGVGLATIGLLVWLLKFDPRRWMKALGVLALVAVITQGILGGTRVTQVSTFLAAVHGCTGQAFFGLLVALAVFTSRDWLQAGEPVPDSLGARQKTTLLLALVSGQIVLGAWLRHYGSLVALSGHGLMALAVLAIAFLLAGAVLWNPTEAPFLAWPARWLLLAVVVQASLGLAALVYLLPFGGVPAPVGLYEAMVRTGHQTSAALLLASSVVLALRAWRHLEPVEALWDLEQRMNPASSTGVKPASVEIVT